MLRISPAVPLDPKMAVEDCVLPSGVKVKKGTMVRWKSGGAGGEEEY